MRAIAKGREPPSLTAHRKTPHADYDNYRDKGTLRHALVFEQRGLCCYCMGRIVPDASAMKIEHWQSQEHHCDEQLVYRNLLGACLGGEGRPFRIQHCDTRKGDNDLLRNPADPTHTIEGWVQYGSDGTIKSNDATFDSQLNEILNLNLPFLKNRRKAIYDAINQWWKKENAKRRGRVPRDRIERVRDKYITRIGQLTPCCQVAVWLLNQKLARSP